MYFSQICRYSRRGRKSQFELGMLILGPFISEKLSFEIGGFSICWSGRCGSRRGCLYCRCRGLQRPLSFLVQAVVKSVSVWENCLLGRLLTYSKSQQARDHGFFVQLADQHIEGMLDSLDIASLVHCLERSRMTRASRWNPTRGDEGVYTASLSTARIF